MNKHLLFAIFLGVILGVTYLVVALNKPLPTYVPGRWQEADTAVQQAEHFYALRKQTGEDFKLGPCLSNDLMPGWVADIAHNPRASSDNLPENQCSAYLEGRAKHFVELDPNGNVIRVQ